MAIASTSAGIDRRAAEYGPAVFGGDRPVSDTGTGDDRRVTETSMGKFILSRRRSGDHARSGSGARDPRSGRESDVEFRREETPFVPLVAAFQAQLMHQQSASFKPTGVLALAQQAAETYHRIMAATQPAGLRPAIAAAEVVDRPAGVNFLA
ncbi:MAG: hypothetical protein QGH73_03595 [Rhodospirillales bacterium]|jgi:hypothetical protein|nr:hypothetical protein [Rhodospirillales bacterium]